MIKLIIAGCLVLASASAIYPQCSASPAVRAAIEAANKAFVDHFNSANAAAVAAMYAADAQLHPPNSTTISSRQAIQSFWQNLINARIRIVRLETTLVEACGETAYEVGKYELTIPAASGAPTTDQGKYLVIWKKQGRRWRLAQDMWNTNRPVQ